MTNRQILSRGEERLKDAQIFDYRFDAKALLEYVANVNIAKDFFFLDSEATEENIEKYNKCIEKRANHIPLQHITGAAWFMGYEFFVNENVLIPRFDTEILVENALKVLNDNSSVLDICTGSGCIIESISLLKNNLKCVATDISGKALEVARKNALQLGVHEVTFIETDLADDVNDTFDMIVSNPPYIVTDVIETLSEEVKCHEPRLALDGGSDGLIFYRRIVAECNRLLNRGGYLFMEIGFDQGDEVKALMEKAGFAQVEVIKDYAGLDRVVKGQYK